MPRSLVIARPLIALLLVVTVGCATAREGGPRAPVRTLPEGLAIADVRKLSYGAARASRPAEQDVVDIATAALAKGGNGDVAHDPTLDDLAAVIATTLAEESAFPARSLLQWTMWQAGVTGVITSLAGDHGPSGLSSSRLDEILAERAGQVEPAPGARRRFGVARVASKGHVGQVLVVVKDACRVTAAEKRVEPGAPWTLAGTCFRAIDDAVLYVDDEGAHVRAHDVKLGADGTFTLTVDAPRVPGVHHVELTGVLDDEGRAAGDGGWRRSLLHFPIYVGTDEPLTPDGVITNPAANPDDVATWADVVVARLNAARAEAGVPPLALDPRLGALAEGTAKADAGEVLHVIDLRGELLARGLPIKDGRVVAGRTEYLDEELWSMLLSPSMRSALLGREMSLVGVGFGAADEVGTRHHRILVAAPVGTLDPTTERARLMRRVEKRRAGKGKPPMVLDDALTRIVQAHAVRVCDGQIDLGDSSLLQSDYNALRRASKGNPELNSIYATYVDPFTPDATAAVVASDANRLGIGVCQGTIKGRAHHELVVYLAIRE